MTIHVELVSQEGRVFEERAADMVLVPATEGIMGVLPRHSPVLTTLDFGELVIRKGNAEERFVIYGGVVDVRPGKIVLLADTAASAHALDMQAAEEARERAREMLAESLPEDKRRDAALQLRRAELAIRVSRKLKQGPSMMRIIEDEESGD
ncbi:MAG: ATP synthase F1 subunit epsilon [Phototrophicaceae bacterium]